MMNEKLKKEYYAALLAKDPQYDGVFFVGITTTGVFCRSVCPARKPKSEHCQFFDRAEEALLAGFRPCKRCQPLCHPDEMPPLVKKLIDAVEENPEKRWKEKDFCELSINAKQASRLFKKRFHMTFVAYARARRMGIALKEIKEKKSVTEGQHEAGYRSGSGFRDAFSKIMGTAPIKTETLNILKANMIDTPLGPMLAVADEKALYLLEFISRRGLEREIENLRNKTQSAVVPGKTAPIISIEKELDQYFEGSLKTFQTPIAMIGTLFQKKVWEELLKISFGKTYSYAEIAQSINKPQAVRAIGRANGTNQLAIIIPCHRVINKSGEIGGYGGGIARKRWLLDHER